MSEHGAVTKRLINTEYLEYIIELVLWSGYIQNADPLSLIISSLVGAGKTELIKLYRKCQGVKFLTEATAFGIKEQYLDDISIGKIRHILIGDLLTPLSKQKKTRDDFIAFFNTLIEEGVGSVHTYAQHWDGKEFVKCGLITTIAEPDLLRKSRRWYEMGFLSRAIPVSYSYSNPTKVKIYQHIATSDDLKNTSLKTIWLPRVSITVRQNKSLNMKLIELAMGTEEWEKVYGFRRLEQLQTLLMANALKNGRMDVTEEDYDKILDLSKYINLKFKEI
jgi:hypothetical protein